VREELTMVLVLGVSFCFHSHEFPTNKNENRKTEFRHAHMNGRKSGGRGDVELRSVGTRETAVIFGCQIEIVITMTVPL
jgi:hypothetical protein